MLRQDPTRFEPSCRFALAADSQKIKVLAAWRAVPRFADRRPGGIGVPPKEGLTDVDSNLLAGCAREAGSLLATLEAGNGPDLQQLSVSFGPATERLLCHLFHIHPAASRYWVDGLIVDAAAIQTRRAVAVQGRAWCADHETQWHVPVMISCTFRNREPLTLLSMTIRIGDADFKTLGEHRDRNITRRAPEEWLFEFEIAGITAEGKAGVKVRHADRPGE